MVSANEILKQCAQCEEMGYICPIIPSSRNDGSMTKCRNKTLLNNFSRICEMISPNYQIKDLPFDGWDFTHNPKVEGILKKSIEWLEGKGRNKNGIFFFSNQGTGKTRIMIYLLLKYVELGGDDFFYITSKALHNEFVKESRSEANRMDLVRRCRLLVIDDIGESEGKKEFFQAQLKSILDFIEGRKIVISSNYPIQPFKGFVGKSLSTDIFVDEGELSRQLISRLSGFEIIYWQGKDMRGIK